MDRKRDNESPVSDLRRSARKRADDHLPEKKAASHPAKKAIVSHGAAKPKEEKVEASSSKKAKASGSKAEVKDEKALTPRKTGSPGTCKGKAKDENVPTPRKRGRSEAGKAEVKDEKAPTLRKSGKPAAGKGKVEDEEDEDVVESAASNILSRKIVVEACTQCRSFKETAEKVKTGFESAIPGIPVEINAQKPRRGYFEIRDEKNEVILSLPSMTRPFTPMKQLNMDEIVEDLIKRCS